MKVNELRIGNLIQWKSTGNIEIVRDIFTVGKNRCKVNSVSISDIIEIPLTEEILIKAGFEKYKWMWKEDEYFNFNKTYNSTYTFSIEIFNNEATWEYRWDRHNFDIHLKYVHQLQNLYFALTGKEIEINL